MDKLEQQVREAYESASMPTGLKEKTRAYLAEQREMQGEQPLPSSEAKDTHNDLSQRIETSGDHRHQQPKESLRPSLKRRRRKYPVFALAACLIFGLLGFGVFKMQVDETAFVSIDVNPSFELGLNRFNVVTSVKALNDDAQGMLEELPLKGMSFEDALAVLTSNESFKAYLTDTSFMDISIVCGDGTQSDRLLKASESCLSTLPCEGSSYAASRELREGAQSENMGVGKYQAALKLMKYDNAITFDDCRSMSMRELRDRIASYEGDTTGTVGAMQYQGEHRGQGQGQGQGMHSME